MERFFFVRTLKFLGFNRGMSTVPKPVITMPKKWQDRMIKELNEEQNEIKQEKSKQGNTKVLYIIKCDIVEVPF